MDDLKIIQKHLKQIKKISTTTNQDTAELHLDALIESKAALKIIAKLIKNVKTTNDWQPFDTVPKDGSLLRLRFGYGEDCIRKWSKSKKGWIDYPDGDYDYDHDMYPIPYTEWKYYD